MDISAMNFNLGLSLKNDIFCATVFVLDSIDFGTLQETFRPLHTVTIVSVGSLEDQAARNDTIWTPTIVLEENALGTENKLKFTLLFNKTF